MLERRLPPVAASARDARHTVRERVAGDLPGRVVEDLLLVASELVSNSVVHAGLGEHEDLSLRLRRRGGRVRVEVQDRGVGYRPGRSSDGDGGRGLEIVACLSDRWGLESNGGTTVWAELPAG